MSFYDLDGDLRTPEGRLEFNIASEKRKWGLDKLSEEAAKGVGIERFFRSDKSRYKWKGDHRFLSPLEAAAKAKLQKSKTLKKTLEKGRKVTKVTEIKKVKTISSKRQKGG